MDKKTIFIFLLVLFSLKCFDAAIARTGALKNLCYAYMAVAIILSIPSFFKYKGGFVLPVQLIAGSTLISIFMASYTWGQGLEYSPTTIPYMMWFAFFFLMSANVSIKTIENIVLIYGALYIILFLFQFTHSEAVYFGAFEEFREDRGIVRVNFPGGGVFFLSCFIAITKVTSGDKHKYLWLAYALVGIVVNVLQVTRQTIAVMLLIYLIHFLRNVKLPLKIATAVVFCLGVYVFFTSENVISRGLTEQQKVDTSAGGDYIRILCAEYYLTEFTPNTISKVFGNGFFNDNSNYGKALIAISQNYGYFLSDVGIVELYITFGVLAIIGYLIIFVKSFTVTLSPEHYYLRYYLWLIMLTSLSSDILISYYYVITTVFVLYCYQRLYEHRKLIEQIEIKAI